MHFRTTTSYTWRIFAEHDWFDECNGIFRPLHSFNRLRIPWISAHLNKNKSSQKNPLEGLRILDIGCGAGILSLALCRLGAQVIGLDSEQSVLEIAQKYSKTVLPHLRGNVEFICNNVELFAERDDFRGSFDAIVASEVVEHVTDLRSFIHCSCKLAKSNAPIFFTTINRTLCSRFFAKTIAEDILRLLPSNLHDFDKFVTPSEFLKLLLDEQCHVGPSLGLSYNPMLNYWNWTNFTDVNYALVAHTKK